MNDDDLLGEDMGDSEGEEIPEGQEMEEMLQKLSSRLTSKPPSTSVQQLH